ncbi:MAG TPA: DUF3159 domain-containing protein [Kribbella sp.]|nr:DUF3159 domain-containing protein [Kribbella sp.]
MAEHFEGHDGRQRLDDDLDEKLAGILRPELEAAETMGTGPEPEHEFEEKLIGILRVEPDTAEDEPAASAAEEPVPRRPPTTDKDFFHALGGWGALLDIGLPWIAFLIVYSASGHDLQLALIVAVASAAAVAVLRLLRKQPLRNIAGGFIGVLVAAYVANRSGRAEDVYLPGLLVNLGYGALYLLTVLIRWPLFGVIYGVITQTGTSWRKDPAMLKGFSRATLVFVGLFAVRLVVQVPLYLMGSLNALGIAKVALGLPFYALALWLSYVVLRATLPRDRWDEARDTVTHLLRGRK